MKILDDELKKRILDLYPEYNALTEYGQSTDSRYRVRLYNTNISKKQTLKQRGKLLLEVKLNRRLYGEDTVDHIDGNCQNDDMGNLQLLTRKENSSKGALGNKYASGLKRTPESILKFSGEKGGMSKVTNAWVRCARDRYAENLTSKKDLMKESGLTEKAIISILKGESYKMAGGKIVYISRKRSKNRNRTKM